MRDAALARAHEGCSVASLAWTSNGALYVTVVVKASVSLRHGGPGVLVTPAPVIAEDRFAGREDVSSLAAACELLPYRPRVDVTFLGHAHLDATGVGVARFSLRGQGGWIDKTLEVRPPPSRSRTRAPAARVQLGWEGTWADEDNPIGVIADGSARAWITDPSRPGASAGLGPLAGTWPRRAGSLGGADPRFLLEDAPRFPDGFDWEYFHVAPLDQQLAWLEGDEALELEGLVEGYPSLQTQLPQLAAGAWAYAPWEVAEGQPLDLIADTLVVDGDRGLAHILWRGTYPMLHEEWSLSQLQILATVTPGIQIEPPAPEEALRAPPPAPRTLAGLGPSVAAASLFETDDGEEEEGTRPLTRKEVLAAMAAAGKALPFGPSRRDATRTAELEVPAPSSTVNPEATRPLPLSDVLTADGDEFTVTGDEEVLSQQAGQALPPWLQGPPSGGRDTAVDPSEATPDEDLADEETQVNDAPLRGR